MGPTSFPYSRVLVRRTGFRVFVQSVHSGCPAAGRSRRGHWLHAALSDCPSQGKGASPGDERRTLPDTLDLIVICVEAGMGVDAALNRVGKEQAGPGAGDG